MDYLHSVAAMGVWIKSGSRCEPAETNGISHFVEHMLFKGTRSRTAQHIAREMDSIGGNLDAFTGKETIYFNVKSLYSDRRAHRTRRARRPCPEPDLCAGSISSASVASFLKKSRSTKTIPTFLCRNCSRQSFWKGHPLGWPILGTYRKPVGQARQAATGRPSRRPVSTAETWCFSSSQPGRKLDHDQLVDAVVSKFSALPERRHAQRTLRSAALRAHCQTQQEISPSRFRICCLGVPAPPITDDMRTGTQR